jgi:hypothetical protein
MNGRWFITPHAVDQYRRRVHQCSHDEARDDLIALSARAHFVKPLHSGCELWRTGKPHRLRLIVGPGEGDMPALVTVLAGCDRGRKTQ